MADVIQQCIEARKRSDGGKAATLGEPANRKTDGFDAARTLRITVWTALIGTPVCHFWFPLLEKLVPLKGQGTSLIKRVAGRVAVDQMLCSPILMAGFLGFMSAAERGALDRETLERKLAKDLPSLLPVAWAMWAPVHMLTFSVVPDRLRVLWIGSFNLVWGTILSSYSATPPPPQQIVPLLDPSSVSFAARRGVGDFTDPGAVSSAASDEVQSTMP